MHADEGGQDVSQRSDERNEGSNVRQTGGQIGVPATGQRTLIWKTTEILRALPQDEYWVDSDGWHSITAYTVCPDPVFETEKRGVILAIAKRLPLIIRIPYQSEWPMIVWLDEEYMSLRYDQTTNFYSVIKRAEVNLR